MDIANDYTGVDLSLIYYDSLYDFTGMRAHLLMHE
jgi:hypothetical protein